MSLSEVELLDNDAREQDENLLTVEAFDEEWRKYFDEVITEENPEVTENTIAQQERPDSPTLADAGICTAHIERRCTSAPPGTMNPTCCCCDAVDGITA
jgi:hypothetical protein